MEQEDGFLTNALAGEIYQKLKDSDSGEMPYKNYRILFQAGFRDENNLLRDASVEVIEEEGDGYRVYNLIFE